MSEQSGQKWHVIFLFVLFFNNNVYDYLAFPDG